MRTGRDIVDGNPERQITTQEYGPGKRVPIGLGSNSEDTTLGVLVGWNKPTNQGDVGSL